MSALLPGRPDLHNCARIDHNVIPIISRMMRNGICVDKDHFHTLSEYLQEEMKETSKQITSYIPQSALDAFVGESLNDFNVDSPDQIAALLFRHLRIGDDKDLELTPKGDRISTGKKQLERLRSDHPVVPLILQHREYKKLDSTYCAVIPSETIYIPELDRWKFFHKIGLTFTTTGRMTCRRLHQIPIRTELGRLIRQGFITSASDRVYISADYSQIELRALAHESGDVVMSNIFRDDGDIHKKTQDGLDMPSTLDKIQKRLAAKRTVFGVIYGSTDLGLWLTLQSDGVSCTREQCAIFLNGIFDTYPNVRPFIEKHHYRAKRYGFDWNSFGRVTLAPEVRSVHPRVVAEGLRRIQNFAIQSFSAEVFKIGAALVEEFCREVRLGLFGSPKHLEPIFPIHDQILLECERDIAEECANAIEDIMSHAVQLSVPVRCDWDIQEKWTK